MSTKIHIVLLFLAILMECKAHISWIFPKPRTLGSNLEGTNGLRNLLIAGREYGFIWRMLDQNENDIEINLLHLNGTNIKQIKPNKSDINRETALIYKLNVTLDYPCPHCILQLVKQDKESRADVEIILSSEGAKRHNDETECQGRGVWKFQSGCECDSGHIGHYCEIDVDCKENSDCGQNGICNTTWNFDSVCYCEFGRFGRNCELESKLHGDKCFNAKGVESDDRIDFISYGLFDEGCYKQISVADNDFVYSRVVGEEVEIILDFDTKSYAAIGWRPINVDASCKYFSKLEKRSLVYNDLRDQNSSALSPFDCIDMVCGSILNNKLHIRDVYIQNSLNPLADERLGDSNSLTAAFGIEIVDRTIVMFRKSVFSKEPTDHSMGPGHLFGVYAKGHGDANQTSFLYKKENYGVVDLEFFNTLNQLSNSAKSISSILNILLNLIRLL